MRKLATIRKIKEIRPIENADRIELALMYDLEWQVVVEKGRFNSNDLVVYIEIDSWVPHTIAPFLTKIGEEPKIYRSIPGQRLRTKKLKGYISQGLILPNTYDNAHLSQDVTEKLGIIKWISPSEDDQVYIEKQSKIFKYLMKNKIFRNTIGNIILKITSKHKGSFPKFMTKTDEIRIQNLSNEYESWKNTSFWSITEKLDGQSGSYYSIANPLLKCIKNFGVCSRNIWFKTKQRNNWWIIAESLHIKEKLSKVPYNIYIQGEIIGPGIQKNIYHLKKLDFYIFNIKNISENRFYTNTEINMFCNTYGFKMVPLFDKITLPNSIQELLELAKGESILYKTKREGIVVRKGNISFKVINNDYLLSEKDD